MNDYFINAMMFKTLSVAQENVNKDEIPIGCIVTKGKTIIGKGNNSTKTLADSTAHAEMIAITAAQHTLGTKYLDGCIIFVTVEPCLMCLGAMLQSRIKHLVFGCKNEKFGYSNFISSNKIEHKIEVKHGCLENECKTLLKNFLRTKR